jgi:prepilin-type N-terminal cleavage/methylation domain-containing protein/prepilin-type processing-associated H-X9-DG protein
MKRTLSRARLGFTLVELLVVIAIIGVLAGLLLPAVQNAREAARRADCGSKMRNLALAAQQVEIAVRTYPVGVRPRKSTVAGATKPVVRLGLITQLLNGLEQSVLYDMYQFDKDWNDNTPRNSSTPQTSQGLDQDNPTNYWVTQTQLPILNCPSSTNPGRGDTAPEGTFNDVFGITDYSAVLGVSPRLVNSFMTVPSGLQAGAGVLSSRQPGRAADVRDGLTNTIMFAECAGRPNLFRTGRETGTGPSTNRVNGGGWARPASDFFIDGAKVSIDSMNRRIANFPAGNMQGLGGINVTNGEDIGQAAFIATNNSTTPGYPIDNMSSVFNPTTSSTSHYDGATGDPGDTSHNGAYGFYGTGEIYAFHQGGANVAMADGATRFLSASIDLINLARLSTRAGREAIDANAFQ